MILIRKSLYKKEFMIRSTFNLNRQMLVPFPFPFISPFSFPIPLLFPFPSLFLFPFPFFFPFLSPSQLICPLVQRSTKIFRYNLSLFSGKLHYSLVQFLKRRKKVFKLIWKRGPITFSEHNWKLFLTISSWWRTRTVLTCLCMYVFLLFCVFFFK